MSSDVSFPRDNERRGGDVAAPLRDGDRDESWPDDFVWSEEEGRPVYKPGAAKDRATLLAAAAILRREAEKDTSRSKNAQADLRIAAALCEGITTRVCRHGVAVIECGPEANRPGDATNAPGHDTGEVTPMPDKRNACGLPIIGYDVRLIKDLTRELHKAAANGRLTTDPTATRRGETFEVSLPGSRFARVTVELDRVDPDLAAKIAAEQRAAS